MNDMSNIKQKSGYATFFFSGICSISCGIIVSMLQEKYGFAYGITGTLLALMNIGNLLAGFLSGVLPSKLGSKKTVLLLSLGYLIGYLILGLSGIVALFMIAFFLIGIAKGCTLNTCTILVGHNSADRTKSMNIMHACYATGALLCPFIITAAATGAGVERSLFVLGACGLMLWLIFFRVPMDSASEGSKSVKTDWSFMKSPEFWLLTGLIFCQNSAETGVTGWMVTYFKGSGIITHAFSPYTVTVMWGATLIGRLIIAFVLPIKNVYNALIKMSIGCIIFYTALMFASSQTMVILLLAVFAFSMAGMNPTAVACAGRMMSVTSMGVMLPVASLGAIIMPWIVGLLADSIGLSAAMSAIIIPCIGLLIFSIAVKKQSHS